MVVCWEGSPYYCSWYLTLLNGFSKSRTVLDFSRICLRWNEEILHQLKTVVYPIIYRFLYVWTFEPSEVQGFFIFLPSTGSGLIHQNQWWYHPMNSPRLLGSPGISWDLLGSSGRPTDKVRMSRHQQCSHVEWDWNIMGSMYLHTQNIHILLL